MAGAVAGLADVDAITLSVADLSNSGAVAVNTGVKVGIAFAVGGRRIGARVALPLLATLLAGALVVWIAYPA